MRKLDVTINGFVSGLVAGLAILGLGLVEKIFGLTDRTYSDLGQALLLSKVCPGIFGFLVGVLAHLGIAILGGAMFTHFIAATGEEYLTIKGIVFGVALWVFFLSIGTFYKMPVFRGMPAPSALLLFFGSALFGAVLAWMTNKLWTGKVRTEKREWS